MTKLQKTGAVNVAGEMKGFFISAEDFSGIEQKLFDLIADSGTQPAYARGVARGAGAIVSILTGHESPTIALKNPAYTTEFVSQLRSRQKEYQ